MPRYDAIVIGAGPAGSVTAFRLARGGRVGAPRRQGALPARQALRRRPHAARRAAAAARRRSGRRARRRRASSSASRYRHRYVRHASRPLILMTQRRRLDAYLAEQAAAAGADFRDGVESGARSSTRTVQVAVELGGIGVTAEGADRRRRGERRLAADSSVSVREPTYGVALEGNLPYARDRRGALSREGGRRARHRPGRLRLGVPEGRPRELRRRRLGAHRA